MRELMLHVGFDDGIDRDHVLQYCLDADVVDESHIERVRVIKRRSFIILPSASADILARALKGRKLQGRSVRVTFAAQDDENERGRSFGGRSRGGFSGGRSSGGRSSGGRSSSGGDRGKRFGNNKRRANSWR